ncbi:hypothetical protein JCM6882_002964 [Rhodosporidiobolus microsporus]
MLRLKRPSPRPPPQLAFLQAPLAPVFRRRRHHLHRPLRFNPPRRRSLASHLDLRRPLSLHHITPLQLITLLHPITLLHLPLLNPPRTAGVLPRKRPLPDPLAAAVPLVGQKKRGPVSDALLFGEDPKPKREQEDRKVKLEIKPEPRPALTKDDKVLFSKAKPLSHLPLFPKAVHHRSTTAAAKPPVRPAEFKPVEDLNKERIEAARKLQALLPPKEERPAAPTNGASAASKPNLSLSPKQRKAVAPDKNGLTSSPPIHPRMDFSPGTLGNRLGRPIVYSDVSDSSSDAVIVSSTTAASSAANRSRAASPHRRDGGAGANGADKGKGKKRDKGKERAGARKSVSASSKPRREISPELGLDGAAGSKHKQEKRPRKKEEWYWRNLDVEAGVPPAEELAVIRKSTSSAMQRNSMDVLSTSERLLDISIAHFVILAIDAGSIVQAGSWELDFSIQIFDSSLTDTPLAAHDEHLVLVPSSIPGLPPRLQPFWPSGEETGHVALPFSLADDTPRPLTLSINLTAGRTTYTSTLPIPATSSYGFDGTLRIDSERDELFGIRASLSITTPRRLPQTEDGVVDALVSRLGRVELEQGAAGQVWVPDAVRVEVPARGAREKEAPRMPHLGLGKGGYDFVTKEPYETSEVVKLHDTETVESLSSLIKGFDQRIATSSMSFEDRVIARAHTRFGTLNPLPPTVALREIACWRYYAPLVHHFRLHPHLSLHLVERFKRRLLTKHELREVLSAYDAEVDKIERGERVGYEEWRRRVLGDGLEERG